MKWMSYLQRAKQVPIWGWVAFAHLLCLLLAFTGMSIKKPLKQPSRPIVVRTHTLPKPMHKPAPVVKETVKKRPTPTSATTHKSKQTQRPTKKSRAKPKAKKPSANESQWNSVFSKIDQLDKDVKGQERSSFEYAYENVALESSEEENPFELLIDFLSLAIELPKKGKVHVQFSVMQGGQLCSIKVLSADEKENADYVLNTMPQMTLPHEVASKLPTMQPLKALLHGIES